MSRKLIENTVARVKCWSETGTKARSLTQKWQRAGRSGPAERWSGGSCGGMDQNERRTGAAVPANHSLKPYLILLLLQWETVDGSLLTGVHNTNSKFPTFISNSSPIWALHSAQTELILLLSFLSNSYTRNSLLTSDPAPSRSPSWLPWSFHALNFYSMFCL